MRILRLLAAFSSLAAPCFSQADFWVDPVLGSDLAAGTEAAPFRTATKGLEVALPATTVHLLPGTYDAASGEDLPLTIPEGVSLVSVGGKEVTTIRGNLSGVNGRVANLRSGAKLMGVTLTSPAGPMVVGAFQSSSSAPRWAVQDCDFVGGRVGLLSGAGDIASCRFISQTRMAVQLYSSDLQVENCEIVGTSSSRGVGATYFYYDSVNASLDLTRCTITQCGAGGICVSNSSSPSYTELRVSDSIIANSGCGVILSGGFGWTIGSILVDGCTLANNGSDGVSNTSHDTSLMTVRSTISWGHAMADVGPSATVEMSLTGDGSGGSASGNLIGDPRFVDPQGGDWSLRFDSPCLDRGHPSATRPDRVGRVRAIDSDLDLTGHPDMGALEHATLVGPLVAKVGDPMSLGVTGPSGGFSTVMVAPGGFAPFGVNTIYGRMFLAPQGSFRITPVLTTGGGPTWIDMTTVLDPAWIGTTVGFQALPRSLAAPAGAALSNPMLVQVQ